jgi:hypothetical protein
MNSGSSIYDIKNTRGRIQGAGYVQGRLAGKNCGRLFLYPAKLSV